MECAGPPALWQERSDAAGWAFIHKAAVRPPRLRLPPQSARGLAHSKYAITANDREIEPLAYELYGITPEEIALVEGTSEKEPRGPRRETQPRLVVAAFTPHAMG